MLVQANRFTRFNLTAVVSIRPRPDGSMTLAQVTTNTR